MSPEALSQLIFTTAQNLVASGKAGDLTVDSLPSADKVSVSRPKDRAHGDWATNIALQLGKKAGMKPRDLAQLFADSLSQVSGIAKVEIAGPGFINIFLDSSASAAVIDDVLKQGSAFGKNDHLGNLTYNLEFVSANPTGPIHIGGTRWAALGDSLGRIIEANGGKVVREYYFNDHGVQIDHFAQSLVAAAHGEPVPQNGYKGQYINDIAQRVIDEAKADGVDVLSLPRVKDENGDEGDSEQREAFRSRGVAMMFQEIQDSLENFRTHFDVWFHENSLYEDGEVERALNTLRDRGLIYKKDGAEWFQTTKFGDDKDRVIVKSNGETTYFVADIAYYSNKRFRKENPADICIYMLGADHHGYVKRLQAVCGAFGGEPYKTMQVLIGQFVNVLRDGKVVRMSKRAGTVVTIEDLVDAVGVDAARYALIRTSYNQPLDIDLGLLTQHTNNNPVYYVQYAHARSKNVDRNAASAGITTDGADLSLLDTKEDKDLLAQIALFPSVVLTAADLYEPHRIAHYLEDLAGAYHSWYNAERVTPMELTDREKAGDPAAVEQIRIRKDPEPARAAARLKLNDAAQQVIENGLALMGVTAPDHM